MISVIVPVYNVESYLPKCLDSIIAQTYTDLEILIIDDGSTDRCGAICDSYAERDRRIRVFHTENRGLSAARNLGLDHAKGEYIGFVDSDDWIEPDMYEVLLRKAEETGADVVTCRFYQEYTDRTETFPGPENEFAVKGDEILRTYLLSKEICQDSWNNLFKAELFQTLRYPEGRSFEDIATKYLLLQKAEKLVYIPSCLLHYRNRKHSLSNNHSLNSLVDYWLAYKERFDALSPISAAYYHLTLSETVNAVSRMWRWLAGCSKEEQRQAKKCLNDMQRFIEEHSGEIMTDPTYSCHIRFTCQYAKSQNPLLFRALHLLTTLYRRSATEWYFEE